MDGGMRASGGAHVPGPATAPLLVAGGLLFLRRRSGV
ncbi:MAG: hypothetical protein FJ292_09895 [Planctomycetes bacterium]|nr:hypothetical protein [Planctomycetota bacterium]